MNCSEIDGYTYQYACGNVSKTTNSLTCLGQNNTYGAGKNQTTFLGTGFMYNTDNTN